MNYGDKIELQGETSFYIDCQLKKSKETFNWIGLFEVTFNINQFRITDSLLLSGHEMNSFLVERDPLGYLIFQSGSQFHKSNKC